MKKLLFVTYGAGHAQSLLPIIDKLKWSYDISVLALTTAKTLFDGNGYTLLSYESLSYLEDEEYKSYGEILAGNHGDNSVVSRNESIAYHGINFLNLVSKYGAELAFEKYSLLGRQCFLPVNFMTKVLKKTQPDLVVATSSPRSERAALEAARNLNINSICVVDLFALQEKEWVGTPNYATKVCVINSFVKDMLVNEGRLANDIIVTGNPAFDKLSDKRSLVSAQKYRKVILPKGKKILFWASQPEPEIHPFTRECDGDPDLPIKIENYLINLVEKSDDWILVIRHHPSENRSHRYDSQKVLFSKTSESMTDVLFSCDCLVTIASTIALEAHLIGKPVVTVDMSIFTADAPFSDMKISLGVKNLLDLESAIERAMNFNNLNASENSPLSATDNVIEIINKVIEQ
jgi:predicted glycosyltransferase